MENGMTTSPRPAYKRILLKLSGEALMGDDAFGINRDTIVRMVEEIAEITRLGVEVVPEARKESIAVHGRNP
jgi:hypothetical protein